MSRTVEITELVLRDAHQSLLATRMGLDDMIPACEDIDKAGYWSVECWGGATFDTCIRFLNEDPWERLRTFRKLMPHSRLQMLLRGQNLLGYRHYEDGVVQRFVEKSAANGIDVFRIFDALNDPRNLKTSIDAVKKTGKHAQGTISYTVSPLHTVEAFAELAQQLREMGCDSICIKDMAALLKPQSAYDLVKAIKRRCGSDMLVDLHTHSTTGVTMVSLMKAIEAGCDIVDTSVGSLSLGPGHNPTESLVEMLDGTGYETRVDLERVQRVSKHFATIRPRYREFFSQNNGVNTAIFKSQIPGGMISNMESQLKAQGASDRLQEVLKEVPNVRKDAGYPPLVTPSSQIIGSQAVFNVLRGKYKMMTGEFTDLILGYYGSTLGEKNPEVLKLAEAQAKKPAITVRPADLLKPEWETLSAAASALKGSNGSDEDVLTYAMFPQIVPKFFETREQGRKNVGKDPIGPAQQPKAAAGGAAPLSAKVNYVITLNGKEHRVTVAPEK
jgi:methylmalonyl-CoA carboxyltransferase 5S subunit